LQEIQLSQTKALALTLRKSSCNVRVELCRGFVFERGEKMEATIKIKTNRIYFEQFETPCGEPEITEVKMAWESAIHKVIEDAGFVAETNIGVGFDPYVVKFVDVSASDECDCDNPSEDCDCEAKSELPDLIRLCEKYGELVAEKAIDAGYEAAAAKSEEFVKASEAINESET